MSEEQKTKLRLEIAHVLFLDIVGYSKLLIDEQAEALQELNGIVRSTDAVRAAEAAGELIFLPTGDGMALVFTGSVEDPVECALQISQALRAQRILPVRMGIHSGPVHHVADVNQRENIAGAGINIAQRVMDCGDAGHILVSKRVADDLAQYRHWQPYLHELGECEVKHGLRIGIVHLYSDEIGNPQTPRKLRAFRSHQARRRWTTITVALLFLTGMLVALLMFSKRPSKTTLAVPEKSIAVLPFENLSRDPDNAFFTNGMQDEILTDLAKIADLKVISRSSVMPYKSGVDRNLRKIGQQLGVSYVVEGSVQRSGKKVRVNAQLIDTRSDAHRWAQTYDRDLSDVFAIQTDIATAITAALQTKLSAAEKTMLDRKPTANLAAYDAYLRGLDFARRPFSSGDVQQAIHYFQQAVQLDSELALAWSWLSKETAMAYFNDLGNLHVLAEEAKQAADRANALQPDLPEAQFAHGFYQYYVESDYDAAIASFNKASRLAPGTSDVPEALALVYRRKGDWGRCEASFRRALELNPRDLLLLSTATETFYSLRDYAAALHWCDAALQIAPGDHSTLSLKVETYHAMGDLQKAAEILSSLELTSGSDPAFDSQLNDWFYHRRYSDIVRAVTNALGDNSLADYIRIRSKVALAVALSLSGDGASATASWRRVRADAEAVPPERKIVVAPQLAMACAALGDKVAAVAAAAVLSDSKDQMFATKVPETMATVALYLGDRTAACRQLALSAQTPQGVSYGDLKHGPYWDALRGDPCFEQIVASLAPKIR